MFKRIAALVVAAGITSALLLYVGTTLMGEFSTAFASSLPALMTGSRSAVQDDTPHAVPTRLAATPDNRRGASKPEDNPTTDNRSGASQPEDTPGVDNRRGADKPEDNSPAGPQATPVPATNVTIAQLLANSAGFEDGVFTLTGIATRVNSDTFLLNDGTGQMLVDLEDDLVRVSILDGSRVTITAEFRRLGGQNGLGLKACVFTDANGTLVLDTCESGRHGELEPADDHGGSLDPTRSGDDHGGSTSPTQVGDDHGGSSNSGSGSSGSNSGSGSSGSGSGKGGGDNNPKP